MEEYDNCTKLQYYDIADILELTLIVGSARLLDPMSSQGGLESY